MLNWGVKPIRNLNLLADQYMFLHLVHHIRVWDVKLIRNLNLEPNQYICLDLLHHIRAFVKEDPNLDKAYLKDTYMKLWLNLIKILLKCKCIEF